ncbi:MAG: nucleotide-binding universal stress UspA family protein [Paracoccaceae bacterium]|jgi:nucleotide-binding universal stress UspA family protein
MSCKTILTYCDAEGRSDERLAAAITVARYFDAHLTVLGMGYEADMPVYAMGDVVGPAIVEIADQARALSIARADAARDALAIGGVLGDAEPQVCSYGAMARQFGGHARFCDLAVLTRPYGDDVPGTAESAMDGALLDGDAPVLICPDGMDGFDPRTVLIAWNNSREALRAVRRAMPILERAETIEIALFDPSPADMGPAEQLAALLSRQGLSVEIAEHVRGSGPISASIATRTREMGADLLVMGAYGKSRFREYVLGGVTRDLLSAPPVPILLAC